MHWGKIGASFCLGLPFACPVQKRRKNIRRQSSFVYHISGSTVIYATGKRTSEDNVPLFTIFLEALIFMLPQQSSCRNRETGRFLIFCCYYHHVAFDCIPTRIW